jgi:hypothetical protein
VHRHSHPIIFHFEHAHLANNDDLNLLLSLFLGLSTTLEVILVFYRNFFVQNSSRFVIFH